MGSHLTPKERLQPSLLDRLADDAPTEQRESRDKRVLSIQRLRECVLRDLGWLFNTSNLQAVQELDARVAGSVLNYGMPDLSGCTSSSLDVSVLERMMRQAILDFEPRILPRTLRVNAVVADEQMNRNALTFEIEGELWAQPLPLKLLLTTEIDLESGDVAIKDSSGSAAY
ncbi:MAG: type VI secretion system baseplate subunit TssE [Planctomycetota bacterium]